jgi:hypothetical protein
METASDRVPRDTDEIVRLVRVTPELAPVKLALIMAVAVPLIATLAVCVWIAGRLLEQLFAIGARF